MNECWETDWHRKINLEDKREDKVNIRYKVNIKD